MPHVDRVDLMMKKWLLFDTGTHGMKTQGGKTVLKVNLVNYNLVCRAPGYRLAAWLINQLWQLVMPLLLQKKQNGIKSHILLNQRLKATTKFWVCHGFPSQQ